MMCGVRREADSGDISSPRRVCRGEGFVETSGGEGAVTHAIGWKAYRSVRNFIRAGINATYSNCLPRGLPPLPRKKKA